MKYLIVSSFYTSNQYVNLKSLNIYLLLWKLLKLNWYFFQKLLVPKPSSFFWKKSFKWTILLKKKNLKLQTTKYINSNYSYGPLLLYLTYSNSNKTNYPLFYRTLQNIIYRFWYFYISYNYYIIHICLKLFFNPKFFNQIKFKQKKKSLGKYNTFLMRLL